MQHLRGRIAKSDVPRTYVRTHVRTYLRIQHCVSALRCRDKNEVNKCKKTLKMYGDVGIAEQQKL